MFLLSAKAGGVGLNLTGASRLILYDNDWNPSSDLQAMSRIWRDGQKRTVFIYRLITNGTIEEKIFQRQISKTSLSSCVMDRRNADYTPKLSDDELKDLFTIQEDFELCSTHELLECHCDCTGNVSKYSLSLLLFASLTSMTHLFYIQIPEQQYEAPSNSIKMNELMLWEHHQTPINAHLLNQLCLNKSTEEILFIFRNLCNAKK